MPIFKGHMIPTVEFYDLIKDRKFMQAYDSLMQHPEILDDMTVEQLRGYYKTFQGLLPEKNLSRILRTLEDRIKSTELVAQAQ
ncbi:MAG: hypothetical protein NTW17_01320 [Candidatus Pacearchaeota archaeon]|nr:hypothetical protein [Candidatus Pacearchaeota archaeon]